MDRDSFVERHAPTWDRLAELVGRRHLTPAESDELVRLYLRASSHLASARRRYADPELLLHLNTLVARANARVYGTRTRTLQGIRHAFTHTFPAAMWHLRRPILLATAVFVAVFAATTVWIATTPAALDVAIPPEVREAYLAEDFVGYYSSQPAGQFAALVFTNNARIGILAFASGIAFAVPTLAVLAYNALNVGVAAGAFHAAGRAPLFWGLILPHGLLELSAIFVAAGTGLALGWSLVSPGDRTRAARAGRAGPTRHRDRRGAGPGVPGGRAARGLHHPVRTAHLGPRRHGGAGRGDLHRLRGGVRAGRGGRGVHGGAGRGTTSPRPRHNRPVALTSR